MKQIFLPDNTWFDADAARTWKGHAASLSASQTLYQTRRGLYILLDRFDHYREPVFLTLSKIQANRWLVNAGHLIPLDLEHEVAGFEV